MALSSILRDLRKERNLTQSELAKLAGLTTSCISMIETGQREANANTIAALSVAFNVTADYLLGIEDDFGNKIVTPELSENERRLLKAFIQLDEVTQEKLIEDAEWYASRANNIKSQRRA